MCGGLPSDPVGALYTELEWIEMECSGLGRARDKLRSFCVQSADLIAVIVQKGVPDLNNYRYFIGTSLDLLFAS